MTVELASNLSRVLVDKLEQRLETMGKESAIAFGLTKAPSGFNCPPPWGLAAARIATESWAKIFRIHDGPGPVQADQFGVFLGMNNAWRAVLNTPTPETQKLEQKAPALGTMRARLNDIYKRMNPPDSSSAELAAKAMPSSREQVEIAKGQYTGASAVVDGSGELKTDLAIRTVVCLFIWLYWPDIMVLDSIAGLRKFFEEFRQDEVTQKNLEKVCGEIGLRFRGRGRPKNPTTRNRPVGIKKVKTRIKRGDEHPRPRKRNTG